MIRLPLHGHFITPHPEGIVVGTEENGENTVTLTIELERGELVGRRHLPDEVDRPEVEDVVLSSAALWQHYRDRLLAYIAYLEACQLILTEQLKSAENETTVYRDLTPEQARALAAMLVHYAGEIERRYR